MNGPSVVCVGCGGPSSFVKPVCDECVRASGGVPLSTIETILMELGMQRGKKHVFKKFTTAEEWNSNVHPGDEVVVDLGNSTEILSVARSAAWTISGGRHVVLVNDAIGSHSLDQIRAVAWVKM